MTARPELIPAVDILAGRAVRLHQGRYDDVIASRDDPDELVDMFVSAGARTVHVVNLDGARDGGVATSTIERITARHPTTRFHVAGGVRSPADVDALLCAGDQRDLSLETHTQTPQMIFFALKSAISAAL